jgi:signal transduction histidine kinase
LVLNKSSFALNVVIDPLVALLQPRCIDKGIELNVDVNSELPAVYGDQRRVQQALGNVLDNAAKFTYAGKINVKAFPIIVINGVSPEFTLPATGWLRDGRWVMIEVTDTGIGIAPENQTRIFEPFAQVDSSLAREFEGTGLGLTIAKRLLEMHNGSIWLRSQPDQGSTFFLALPSDMK